MQVQAKEGDEQCLAQTPLLKPFWPNTLTLEISFKLVMFCTTSGVPQHLDLLALNLRARGP